MKTKQDGSTENNPNYKKLKFYIWDESKKASQEVISYDNGSQQICIKNMIPKPQQRNSQIKSDGTSSKKQNANDQLHSCHESSSSDSNKQDNSQKKNETKSSINYLLTTSELFSLLPVSEERLPIITSPSNPGASKSRSNRPWEIETNENYVSPIPEHWPTSKDNRPV